MIKEVVLGAILTGSTTVMVHDQGEEAKQVSYENATRANLRMITQSLMIDKIKTGRYPLDQKEFEKWVITKFKFEESTPPYMDLWKNKIIYTYNPTTKKFSLRSKGLDGKPETDDDIVF